METRAAWPPRPSPPIFSPALPGEGLLVLLPPLPSPDPACFLEHLSHRGHSGECSPARLPVRFQGLRNAMVKKNTGEDMMKVLWSIIHYDLGSWVATEPLSSARKGGGESCYGLTGRTPKPCW